MNVGILNKIILKLMPHLTLSQNELFTYTKQENLNSKLYFIAASILLSIIHPLHFFYFDLPNKLTIDNYFFHIFRFSSSVIGLIVFTYYYIDKKNTAWYFKFPITLYLLSLIFFQTGTSFYYENTTTFLPYFMIAMSIFIIKASPVPSLFFSICSAVIVTIISYMAGKDLNILISHSVVLLIVTVPLSFRSLTSIELFKSHNENLNAQKKLIERQVQIVDQLRLFLPKVIFKRFQTEIANETINTSTALNNILQPQKKEVCCLYSDIRSFTKFSRKLENVRNIIIPIIKETTDIVENNEGISRKIGDLVFAYYDSDSLNQNICSSLSSAITIAKYDIEENTSINRSIILTAGEAIVGNIGGSDAGFEITAIGNPANLSARIDEHVKVFPELNNCIILSDSFYEKIPTYLKDKFRQYKIPELVKIRNFENETYLHTITFKKVNTSNFQKLLNRRESWQKVC